MTPALAIKNFYRVQEQLKIEGQPDITVLQMPSHGTLMDVRKGSFAYYPEKGYLGNDRATLLVEVGGKRVKMEYFFRVMQSIPQQYDESMPTPYEESNCPKKTRVWKISSSTDVYGNNFIAAVDYQSLTANATGSSASGTATWASTLSTGKRNWGQTTVFCVSEAYRHG